MSDTFELSAEIDSLTVGRYAGPYADGTGSHRRYSITDAHGGAADSLTRTDLAGLALWIIAELAAPHPGS